MREYKIGQVFEDAENFNPPKRLKCVECGIPKDYCVDCAYNNTCCIDNEVIKCIDTEIITNDEVYFIETSEPLSDVTE